MAELPPELRRPMTPRQVADRYSKHLETVYGWLRSGKLGSFRLPGGEYRIKPEHIDAFEAGEWADQSSPSLTTPSEPIEAATGKSAGPRAARRDPYRLGSATKPQPTTGSPAGAPGGFPLPHLVGRSE